MRRAKGSGLGEVERELQGQSVDGPVRPSGGFGGKRWANTVNRPQTEDELAALRRSVEKGRPFGSEAWTTRVAGKLRLRATLRGRSRPRKDGRGRFSGLKDRLT